MSVAFYKNNTIYILISSNGDPADRALLLNNSCHMNIELLDMFGGSARAQGPAGYRAGGR